MNFRLLKANEIDCRISTVKDNGVSILLYKDARVDQNILDETVGPMRWKRSHELIGDRLYCTVSIKDKDTGEWISKQDVGTESYTEKEKGQASDSFKRACFNWGIGRELYTAPFIWISADKCKIAKNNGKAACYDTFCVKEIGYDENRNINMLVITGAGNRTVFSMGKPAAEPEQNADRKQEKLKVQQAHVNTLFMELKRTGVGMKGVLSRYSLSDIHDMDMDQFRDAMEILKRKPCREPVCDPPIDNDSGLPWNTPGR